MNLSSKLNTDLKEAMKAKIPVRVDTLRMLISAIKNEGIEKYRREKTNELNDEEVVKILKRELKKRKESNDIYTKAGRMDLADKEKEEANIISGYLPIEMDEALVRAIIEKIINSGVKNVGEAIKLAVKETNGQASGKLISDIARELIGSQ